MSPHECQDFCGVGTTWAMTLNRQSKDPCSRPSTRRGGAPLQHHLSRSLPAPRSSKATASSPTRKFSGSMIRSGAAIREHRERFAIHTEAVRVECASEGNVTKREFAALQERTGDAWDDLASFDRCQCVKLRGIACRPARISNPWLG